jgi:hypothetical protein
MTPSISTFFKVFTYFALAILAYGIFLFIKRKYFNRYFSNLPLQKQNQMLKSWRQLLLIVRISLIGLPICFTAGAIILWIYASIPIAITAPPFILMYLDLLVIYIDRRWHIKALTQTDTSIAINGSDE